MEGRTAHYATAVLFEGYAQPVLATTSAGRPIKLEGNPDHPAFRGGSTPFIQAAILDLYDPDRSQAAADGRPSGELGRVRRADGALARRNGRQSGGAGLRILVGPTTSPTLLRQIGELRAPCRRRASISSIRGRLRRRRRSELRPNSSAQVVVSLDDDLLGPGPAQAIHARGWGAARRRSRDQRMRLFMAETTPTQTGAKADRRLAVPPSRLPLLAQAIAARLGGAGHP